MPLVRRAESRLRVILANQRGVLVCTGIVAGQSVMRELKTYGAASMYGNEP